MGGPTPADDELFAALRAAVGPVPPDAVDRAADLFRELARPEPAKPNGTPSPRSVQ